MQALQKGHILSRLGVDTQHGEGVPANMPNIAAAVMEHWEPLLWKEKKEESKWAGSIVSSVFPVATTWNENTRNEMECGVMIDVVIQSSFLIFTNFSKSKHQHTRKNKELGKARRRWANKDWSITSWTRRGSEREIILIINLLEENRAHNYFTLPLIKSILCHRKQWCYSRTQGYMLGFLKKRNMCYSVYFHESQNKQKTFMLWHFETIISIMLPGFDCDIKGWTSVVVRIDAQAR